MNKFLKLCEMYDPSNSDVKDAAFQAKFFLYEQEIPFSSEGDEIILHAEQGDIVLKVLGIKKREDSVEEMPEEDESINAGVGDYGIDTEVEKLSDKASSGLKGLAGKAFGTSAQKAKSAVRERQKLAGDAVNAYRKGSERIKKGLQSVKQSAIRKTY
jgi:hypothetical protein